MTENPTPSPLAEDMTATITEVAEVVAHAKAILLEHRVRDFRAEDVLALTKLILDRNVQLIDRGVI